MGFIARHSIQAPEKNSTNVRLFDLIRGTEVTATIGVETGFTAVGMTGAGSTLAQEETRAETKKRIFNPRVMSGLYRIASLFAFRV